jgi:hypothetical protein
MKIFGCIIFVFLSLIFINPCVKANDFSDVNNHWSKENVYLLTQKGAVKGYGDGLFRPNNTITRAEFTKLLIMSIGINTEISNGGHWAEGYIKAALIKRIILEGEFSDIDVSITRGEISTMLVRSLENKRSNDEMLFKGLIDDWQLLPENNRNHILVAFSNGIITGYPDGTFKCDNHATRAEAVTMMVRFLNPDKRIKFNKLNGKWMVQPRTSLSAEFTVLVDDTRITHFTIISQGKQIGGITPISEGICSIPVMFTDPGELTIRLYKENSIIGSAILKSGGVLEVIARKIL